MFSVGKTYSDKQVIQQIWWDISKNYHLVCGGFRAQILD